MDMIQVSQICVPVKDFGLHSMMKNQVPRQRDHGSYIAKIEIDWHYWLNYSDYLLVKFIEKIHWHIELKTIF